jgi:hypothetical protein
MKHRFIQEVSSVSDAGFYPAHRLMQHGGRMELAA